MRPVLLSSSISDTDPTMTAESFLAKYEISSVHAVVEAGMTALHYAAYGNQGDACRKLLMASGDLSAYDGHIVKWRLSKRRISK